MSRRVARASDWIVSRRSLRLSTMARSMTVEPITIPSASARNTATSDAMWKRKLITGPAIPRQKLSVIESQRSSM